MERERDLSAVVRRSPAGLSLCHSPAAPPIPFLDSEGRQAGRQAGRQVNYGYLWLRLSVQILHISMWVLMIDVPDLVVVVVV